MILAIWFWLIIGLIVLFWLLGLFGPEPYRPHMGRAFDLLVIVLIIILGIAEFGGPVRGSVETRVRYVQ